MECILVPDSGILMLVMIILCVIRIAGGVDIAPKECCIRADGLFVFFKLLLRFINVAFYLPTRCICIYRDMSTLCQASRCMYNLILKRQVRSMFLWYVHWRVGSSPPLPGARKFATWASSNVKSVGIKAFRFISRSAFLSPTCLYRFSLLLHPRVPCREPWSGCSPSQSFWRTSSSTST